MKVIILAKTEKKACLELTQNKNITYENLWCVAKAVLRGKFVILNVLIRK